MFPSHDVRHTESRIVKLRVTLTDLSLTDHARNKMIQLAGRRYDSGTNTVTVVGKRCPTRKQNKQYAMYLLKVLYLESNVSIHANAYQNKSYFNVSAFFHPENRAMGRFTRLTMCIDIYNYVQINYNYEFIEYFIIEDIWKVQKQESVQRTIKRYLFKTVSFVPRKTKNISYKQKDTGAI